MTYRIEIMFVQLPSDSNQLMPAQLSAEFSTVESAANAARDYIKKLDLPPGAASWKIVDPGGNEIS